ncbi:hypothetical protein DT075_01670 [Bacillus licheniformis]|nr:hypothetical protein DT075_01670 [Bacillus licheniformis]
MVATSWENASQLYINTPDGSANLVWQLSKAASLSLGKDVSGVRKAKGVKNPDIVYVTSHYDSVPYAPGANDNASGTSVVLELARILKTVPADKEIRFITFGAEEIDADAGASGVIIYNNVDSLVPLTPNLSGNKVDIPVVGVKKEDGEKLLSEQEAILKLKAHKNQTSQNVRGTLTVQGNNVPARPAAGSAPTAAEGLAAPLYDAGLGLPGDFTEEAKGKIAVILRGELTFYEKAKNVKDIEKFSKKFNENRAYQTIYHLSETIGPRVTGTAEEKKSAAFIASQMKKSNLKVSTQKFSIPDRLGHLSEACRIHPFCCEYLFSGKQDHQGGLCMKRKMMMFGLALSIIAGGVVADGTGNAAQAASQETAIVFDSNSNIRTTRTADFTDMTPSKIHICDSKSGS